MAIRIQPREIDIPPGNPFAHDLLGRREQVQFLTSMVSNLEGPCTMAVNEAWGTGKTTFLRMWGQYLRDEGFAVVHFNAWETDFTGEPFVALAAEISEGLKDWQEGTAKPSIEKVTRAAKVAARWVVPGVIRMVAGAIPIAGGEIGQVASTLAAQLLDDYPEGRQSIRDFRVELQAMVDALWKNNDQKPLVVLIDELDRCRPSYAIELLETCKHIFSIDHAVFILAVNRTELAHSVKVPYGAQFDAEGYLRRFFDHEIVLPPPDRELFIKDMLGSLGIDATLSQADENSRLNYAPGSATTLMRCLECSTLSLRSVGQAVHSLGLVLSSLPGMQSGNVRLLIVLAILKAVDPVLYRGFVGSDMTDDEITSSLFGKPEFRDLESDIVSELVEAVIIEARSDGNDVYQPADALETRAPLLWRHHRLARSQSPPSRSLRILSMVQDLYGYRNQRGVSWGLQESARRIEFISPESSSH